MEYTVESLKNVTTVADPCRLAERQITDFETFTGTTRIEEVMFMFVGVR
jgi:hypothetical protein